MALVVRQTIASVAASAVISATGITSALRALAILTILGVLTVLAVLAALAALVVLNLAAVARGHTLQHVTFLVETGDLNARVLQLILQVHIGSKYDRYLSLVRYKKGPPLRA